MGPFLRRRQSQTDEDYARYRDEYAARSEQNFVYFMEQRATRLAALEAFLGKFGVNASLEDAGIASVSAWLPDNGYALANYRDSAVVDAFYQMQTPWTDGLRGLNVIFDIGIFLGEALIRKQPRLHWKYIPGVSDNGESFATGYKIEGFLRKGRVNWLDTGQHILDYCWNDLNGLHSPRGRPWTRADSLVGAVRDYATR